jgi:hypothetical protein
MSPTGGTVMLVSYDRYMREYKAKLLKARLEREIPRDEQGTVAGIRVVQVIRQAMKDTTRNMEGM